MPKMNPSAVVPGQSVSEIGGPTIYDYRPEGDSGKISNEGTSQSKTKRINETIGTNIK